MNIELVKKAQKAFEWYDKAVDNSIDYLNLEREEQQDAWNALDKLFEAIARQSVKSEDVAEAIEQMEDALSPQYLESDGEWTGYNEFSTSAIRTAITALQEYQPWIPVSERLPEGTRAVLVWEPTCKNIYTMYWEHDEWRFFGGKGKIHYHVTHWKPLPEPPKGE